MTDANANDERKFDRRIHRQAALDSMQFADDDMMKGDWQEVAYWQRDSLIHALLALSAESS